MQSSWVLYTSGRIIRVPGNRYPGRMSEIVKQYPGTDEGLKEAQDHRKAIGLRSNHKPSKD
ncbi:hypothetical protein STASHLEY_00080 [Brevundimonas phage vB_BpoS-StAshley]|nr:hypothetical protein STASHLEY_00080 [Brevundimonas phage vB_BpoS-StAshley]UTC30125.1 hypothetical protein MAINES_00860 [Brevundimonas phage vB_BpoS-MaInes]